MIKNSFLIMIFSFFVAGCIAKGRVDIIMKGPLKKSVLNLSIATVRIQNNQLIINGSNLTGVTTIKLIEGESEQVLTVESSTNNEIIANGIAAISLGVGKVFDMVLSNANAAATFPVSFTLNDGSVTATKLAPMGALSGQVLKFNGTNWAPASLIDAQLYKGTWDPANLHPDVGLSSPGDYWVLSAAGTNAGDGITYAIGDWIISDGYSWSKLALSKTSVTSFNGRKGLVNLIPGDYPNLKSGAKIPGSSLNDLANVDITTVAPIVGDVLKWNGTNWVAGAGGAVTVGSAEITDLSITGADIAENTINPSKIYSSSIDSALYLRGDKTWANFAADVLNAPLSTYSLNATVKPTVGITDKIGPALGKIQKFLNDLDGDYVSKTASSQVVSGTFSFTSPTSFLYTQLPTGASPTEVANVQYVNNYVDAAVATTGGYAPATLTTANGAHNSAITTLTVASTTDYPSIGTLLVGSEAISYTGKTATTFTGLTRGAYGTTAAAISNGASINNYILLSRSTTTTTPKMVVTGSGNVGIGTTIPTAKLDITSSGLGTTQSNAAGLSLVNSTAAANGAQQISPAIHWQGKGWETFDPASANVNFRSFVVPQQGTMLPTGYLTFQSQVTGAYADRMVITEQGAVGIGTAAPTQALDVVGSVKSSSTIWASGGNATLSQAAITSNRATTVTMGNVGSGPLEIQAGGATGLSLSATGKVGVGTTSPVEKLEVNGAIKLGTTTNSNAGVIRWDGTNFQGYNGTTWANFVPSPPASGACDTTNTYSSAGTYAYTVPAVFGTITIKIWGGGGAGGSISAVTSGNGAATSITSLGLNAGGGSGTFGSNSTSGSYPGGAGGAASGGDINTNGSAGNAGNLGSNGLSGAGGASPGGGGTGGIAISAGNGQAGTSPGGAGSGAKYSNYYIGGGGAGAYVEKTFTSVQIAPGSTIADIVVGAGGIGSYGGLGTGGDGAQGRATISCSSTGAPIANDRSLLFINGGAYSTDTNFVYTATGNLGIGTTSPLEKLHVVGNLRVQGSTDCTLGNGAGGTNCSSDIRLKENIQAIKDPLHKILSLRGVEFDWNEKSNSPGRHDIGVIAQDIEKVFPTAVFQDPTTGFKKVDYAVLVAPIIQAFKQINKFISELFKASEGHSRDIALIKTDNVGLREKLEADNAKLKNKFEAETSALRKENELLKAKLDKIEKFLEKNKK